MKWGELKFDVDWPAELPRVGPWGVAVLGLMLAAFSVWSYRGARGLTGRRLAALLLCRAGAVLALLFALARPYLESQLATSASSAKALVLVDVSPSMGIDDEVHQTPRLEMARRLLKSNATAAALRELASLDGVEILYYQGAETLTAYDPQTPVQGKRSNHAGWLRQLLKDHEEHNLLGLVLLSDGRETSVRSDETADLARTFGQRRWPIHALTLGSIMPQRPDLIVEKLEVPPLVHAKAKMNVVVHFKALGIPTAKVRLKVFVEDLGSKEMVPVTKFFSGNPEVLLDGAIPQTVRLEFAAPETRGESRLRVEAEPLEGESSRANNEQTAYFDVTEESINILWVEGRKRAFEPIFAIRHALAREKRFQVYYVEGSDLGLDLRHYHVIVIGDLTAQRFTGGDPAVLGRIKKMVQERGTGLIMLGGTETFGNSDWHKSTFADFFPVRFNKPGRLEVEIPVEPTLDGLDYLLRLDDDLAANKLLWQKYLEPLEGMATPGDVDPLATVYARKRDTGEPVLAGWTRGKGRVMTFAGDTTWQTWRRSREAVAGYERFWRKLVYWLARQEKSDGHLDLTLTARQLEVGGKLDFGLSFRSPGGADLKPTKLEGQVIGPSGMKKVDFAGDRKGATEKLTEPGEYLLEVKATGQDAKGASVVGVGKARFLVAETDLELANPLVNESLMKALAENSGGKAEHADQEKLLQALSDLAQLRRLAPAKTHVWPNWRVAALDRSLAGQAEGLWRSGRLFCYVLFVGCLGAEWYLRRRYGLV